MLAEIRRTLHQYRHLDPLLNLQYLLIQKIADWLSWWNCARLEVRQNSNTYHQTLITMSRVIQLTSELTFDRMPIIPFSDKKLSSTWLLGLVRSNLDDSSSGTAFWSTWDGVLIILRRRVVTVGDCSGTHFPTAFTRCFMNSLLLISDTLFRREISGSPSIAAGFVSPFWSLIRSESLVQTASYWLLPFERMLLLCGKLPLVRLFALGRL